MSSNRLDSESELAIHDLITRDCREVACGLGSTVHTVDEDQSAGLADYFTAVARGSPCTYLAQSPPLYPASAL